MPDPIFEDPRLVATYDTFDGPRDDLDLYVSILAELGARTVLDVGCGTGVLARRLASLGLDVIAVDPALASLDAARAGTGADLVTWIHGDATTLPSLACDAATMTGNVTQVFTTDHDLAATLTGIRRALRPGGSLVFETRVPAREAWKTWNRAATYEEAEVPRVGHVATWCDVLEVEPPLVTFRWTNVFPNGTTLESDSTLRFWERHEIEQHLTDCGYVVDDIRDAPDRPGAEYVFLARSVGGAGSGA